jgi:amidase
MVLLVWMNAAAAKIHCLRAESIRLVQPGDPYMVRKLVLTCLLVFSASSLFGQTSLAGNWLVDADYLGTRIYFGLDLDQQGQKLTGKFSGLALDGSTDGASFHFLAKDNNGHTDEVKGALKGGALRGEAVETDPSLPTHPATYTFVATLRPARPTTPPQRREFSPTVFYREFSPFNKPVLTVNPGDTIHTTTVDAAGNDRDSVRRVLGSNPETGPFYIESAMPGDTLVVHIVRLRPNRDWAFSNDTLVQRSTDSGLAVKLNGASKRIIWRLDLDHGAASPAKATGHLNRYTVPLRPMLGCIAAAPSPSQAPPGTGDSGFYGGNMDFNQITDGATLYLPVSNPGALLYLGDAHAAQGDGELNGNALETSMDVEFTVDVIPNKHPPAPRVETATAIMAMGLGSIEEAFREATSNMAQWLVDEYQLTPSELAQVLGTASRYHVSEVADRNAGMVLSIDKARLETLASAAK